MKIRTRNSGSGSGGSRVVGSAGSVAWWAYAVAAVAVIIGLALLVGLGVTVTGWITGSDAVPGSAPGSPASSAAPPEVPGQTEQSLVERPLLDVPVSSAQPHALTTEVAGPSIVLPPPGRTVGVLVPDTFPHTPEGAIGQLAALTKVGVFGADPVDYARAYDSVAEPGATPGAQAHAAGHMAVFREHAGMERTGPKAGLTMSWEPAAALVKGTIGPDYAVVCVLGQLAAEARGQVLTQGYGDCQPMRWITTADGGGQWRVAAGPRPPRSMPSPWPHTAEAVAVGFRSLTPGPAR